MAKAHAPPALTPGELNLKENSTIWKLSSFGELDDVKKLIEQGVNPNDQDERGVTPLAWSARNGHQQV